jgi:ERCC4-type nuclease
MEQVVCVERKSFADFYSCLVDRTDKDGDRVWGRERFENDLQRMSECRYPLVVIEAAMTDLLTPFTYVAAGGIPTRSQVTPLVAQNSLLSWQARYRIPLLLCGERSAASRMTLQHLDTVWRLEREDAAQLRREDKDDAAKAG